MKARKVNVVNMLKLLSDPARQDKYDSNVPIANVAVELVNGWFDDSFVKEFPWFREIFSDDEWSILSEFDRYYEERLEKLPDNYAELRENYFWKEIVGKANWALDMLNWRNLEARYDD